MKIKRILSLLLVLLLIFTACVPADEPYFDDGVAGYGDDRSSDTSQPVLSAADPEPSQPPEYQPPSTAPPTSEQDAQLSEASDEPESQLPDWLPKEGEYYYDVKNVVLYLELYGELPPNYITKDEARQLGWEGGSVEDYKEGAAIGGDYFGNREGLLPKAKGRDYTECDIDTDGYYSRGSRRLVFSNDGLYFYSSDHYETFKEVTVSDDYEVKW